MNERPNLRLLKYGLESSRFRWAQKLQKQMALLHPMEPSYQLGMWNVETGLGNMNLLCQEKLNFKEISSLFKYLSTYLSTLTDWKHKENDWGYQKESLADGWRAGEK